MQKHNFLQRFQVGFASLVLACMAILNIRIGMIGASCLYIIRLLANPKKVKTRLIQCCQIITMFHGYPHAKVFTFK